MRDQGRMWEWEGRKLEDLEDGETEVTSHFTRWCRRSRPRNIPMGSRMSARRAVQGHLAHKKTTIPLGPPSDPRHRPEVRS